MSDRKETDFVIVSKPAYIQFECPYCEMTVDIQWSSLCPPAYWGDNWDDVECPNCGKTVKLGEYDYD